jgi:acetoin utilization protein AcuB
MATGFALSIAAYMTPEPHQIEPSTPLPHALKLMRTHGVRHLPVTARGRLVGVLSKRDVSRMTPLAEAPPVEVNVEDVMSDDPYTVSPSTPVEEVALAMAEQRIGSAVVVDNGRVVGLFTTVDALRALATLVREYRRMDGAG